MLWLRGARAAYRYQLVVAIQAVLFVVASYVACWLRFDGAIPASVSAAYVRIAPWLVVVRAATLLPFGLYRDTWRYASVWELGRIVVAVLSSSALLYLIIYGVLGVRAYPRSVLIIDSLLLISLLGGARLAWRLLAGQTRSTRRRRVLIVGAGDAGEMIVREMRKGSGYQPVGFVDDDPAKAGRTVHGVTVLGTSRNLPAIVAACRPAEVLVALPSADARAVRAIVRLLEPLKLRITTLPSLAELVNGRSALQQIRPLAIEDLLPRKQVALQTDGIRQMVEGRRVLVTGAGGSIGSELSRQIAALSPEHLVLYERYENSLYAIANDLADRGTAGCIHSVIGDVTDAARIDAVFEDYRPEIVFHAAAHKHVPLMEANPCEAVKNNVLGTQIVAEAARRHRVDRFVLISTDKAANPSSVMGATKRVAELIVQAISSGSQTRFVAVRFGNVLGSNGSVIPRMIDQIRAGGPVTVTHPEIRRYFMLIPEAVQLVLQAAVLARGQETFVLDMGEQMKILDVARNLIRLSGFVPDEDIRITFTGLRPGEKLQEQLVGEGESLSPTGTDKLFRVPWSAHETGGQLDEQVTALVRVAVEGRADQVLRQLRRVVPTFKPTLPAPVFGAMAPASKPPATAPVPMATPLPNRVAAAFLRQV